MLNAIFDALDAFYNFLSSITLSSIFNTYWFLFVVEFPRYYLAEIIVVIWRVFSTESRRKEEALATWRLHIDNPLVSILVPGKNEGKNIYRLTVSLAEQTYKNFELIVVDDGSDDDTATICKGLENAGRISRYLRLEFRGGKASAANYGLQFARGKYVVHLDADSSLDRDALERILLPFYIDPRIKAVGGCVKVRNNRDSLCTSMQALEYLKTIMVGRTVSSALGIYRVISGAFGAFDRKVLHEVGGWDIGPGLDGDITQKIRKAGWKVKFTHEAVCLTNVPAKWKNLFKQRMRWSRSLVRFRLRKHGDVFFPSRNFSFLNFLSSFENIFYDFFMNYVWLFYIIKLMLVHNNHIFEVFLLGWFIRCCFALIAFSVVMALTERKRDEFFLIKYLPLCTFYTGYFLRITRLIAHTSELFFHQSYKDKWNPRKASIYAQIEKI